MGYMEEYRKWMESPALTTEEHAELAALEGNEKEIQERFFAPLSLVQQVCAAQWVSVCIR